MADFIKQFTAEEYVNRDNFNSRITQANTGLATVQSAAAAAQQTANGKAPVSHTHAAVDITSGILPIVNGGTGATTAAAARTALGITPANIGAATQSAVEAAQTTANGKANASHTQGAATITAGDFAGCVGANPTSQADVGYRQLRNIYAGTGAMTAGGTALSTGAIYLQYE